jgi:hypothetical protein
MIVGIPAIGGIAGTVYLVDLEVRIMEPDMPERQSSIDKYAFRGTVLWEREYPTDGQHPSVRILIVNVATDTPGIDQHMLKRGRDWIVSPGSYFVAAWEGDRPDAIFALPFATRNELLRGEDARKHPAFSHVKAALEDALRGLFPRDAGTSSISLADHLPKLS